MEYMKGIDGLYIPEETAVTLGKLMVYTEDIRSFCHAFWERRI